MSTKNIMVWLIYFSIGFGVMGATRPDKLRDEKGEVDNALLFIGAAVWPAFVVKDLYAGSGECK